MNTELFSNLEIAYDKLGSSELGRQALKAIALGGGLRDFKIESGKWVSTSNAREGVIKWGTGFQENINDLHFGGISQDEASRHRLLHEMAHLLTLSPDALRSTTGKDLLNSHLRIRKANNYKLGTSAVGSLSFYPPNRRSLEDAADVLALRLDGFDRFAKFLIYLTDDSPDIVENKERVGIATIDDKSTLEIAALTQQFIDEHVIS